MLIFIFNLCTECWPGTRGVQCAEDCAPGFFGRLCREECACDPCDRIKGCLDITQEYINNKTAGMYIIIVIHSVILN